MNSDSINTIPASPNISTPARPGFSANPSRLLLAAADPARWLVLRELVRGRALSLQELAAVAGRTPNQMGKHLAVLRAAGLVQAVPSPDGDGRKQCHAVPEGFRRTDAEGRLMLDFGVCLLRFGDDVRETVSPTAKD